MTSRGGFTLVETLVVSVLGLAILVAVAQVISTQSRGFQHQTTAVMAQANARIGVQVLANELKEVSATGGDLVDLDETSITVRSLNKVGIICDAGDADSGTLDVWKIGGTAFEEGDSVLVFLNVDPEDPTDDSWIATVVEGVSGTVSGNCTEWSEYTLQGTEGDDYPMQRLNLDGGILAGLNVGVNVGSTSLADASRGGPVRSFEHVTYSLDEDGDSWALTRTTSADDGAVVLLKDLAPPADSGLAFSYFDANGTPLDVDDAAADPPSVARIELTVRSRMTAPEIAGNDGTYDNEFTTAVYFRNNAIDQTFGMGGGGGS